MFLENVLWELFLWISWFWGGCPKWLFQTVFSWHFQWPGAQIGLGPSGEHTASWRLHCMLGPCNAIVWFLWWPRKWTFQESFASTLLMGRGQIGSGPSGDDSAAWRLQAGGKNSIFWFKTEKSKCLNPNLSSVHLFGCKLHAGCAQSNFFLVFVAVP